MVIMVWNKTNTILIEKLKRTHLHWIEISPVLLLWHLNSKTPSVHRLYSTTSGTTKSNNPPKPLDGIRVLEMGQVKENK